MTVALPVGFIIFFLLVTYNDILSEQTNLLLTLESGFSCIKPEYYSLVTGASKELRNSAVFNLNLLIATVLHKLVIYFIILDVQMFTRYVIPRLGMNEADFMARHQDQIDL